MCSLFPCIFRERSEQEIPYAARGKKNGRKQEEKISLIFLYFS